MKSCIRYLLVITFVLGLGFSLPGCQEKKESSVTIETPNKKTEIEVESTDK